MKSAFFIALIFLSFSAQKTFACSDEAIQTATSLSDSVITRYGAGTASSAEVLSAKAHVLEMKVCKNPSDKAACADLVSTLKSAFEIEQKRYAGGLVDFDLVIATHTRYVQAQQKCQY